MNKESALQEVRTIEARLAELRKIIEQPEEVGLWEPDRGERFYPIWGNGSTSDIGSSPVNNKFFTHGNCFPTESIARKASQLQRVHNHVMRACFQADPDAGEWSKERCICIFCIYRGSNYKWVSSRVDYTTGITCVHTREQATEACRLLNAWQAKEDAK